MLSADGNLVLVYNGEIYNYRELRGELFDYPYKTKTDSEVILAAFIRWGHSCVDHFKGMFAFAIWDCAKKELYIVRDRLGVKPLYFYSNKGLIHLQLRAEGYTGHRIGTTGTVTIFSC